MWPFSRKAEPPPRKLGAGRFELVGHDGTYLWTPQPDLTPDQAVEVSIITAWIMLHDGRRKNDVRTWITRHGLERHFRFTPNGH